VANEAIRKVRDSGLEMGAYYAFLVQSGEGDGFVKFIVMDCRTFKNSNQNYG
jgi:hypothetical protein